MDFCLLSKFDDLFSDIFLDAQFLWFDTIKLNNDHRRPRIRSDKVLKIIQDHVLATGRTNEAVKALLQMDYFKHYLATKSTKQHQEFIQHMKRYLYMYMPNAGYEIADTRRYGGAGRRVEACVTVTKDWKLGDELRLCTGMIAHLKPQQEHELKKGNRDISVMWSTRKQCNCLFLGPARFVNHDCEPNAKFIALGHNSVTFKIIKDIKCGEELTAFYGKHYFGENNCECRCATCETKRTGYFTPELDDSEYNSTDMEDDIIRRSRKRKSTLNDGHIRRNKRSSIELSKRSLIDLEELIGIDTTEDSGDDVDHHASKQENRDSDQTVSTSPTTFTDIKREHVEDEEEEGEERPQVMSIHFLCNYDDKQQQSTDASHSPLDILCNAVLDAEYLKVQPKQEEITVVVSPEIRSDASDRVRNNQQQQEKQQSQRHLQQLYRWQQEDDDSSDTKADSAVGLSPQLQQQEIQHQKQKSSSSSSGRTQLPNLSSSSSSSADRGKVDHSPWQGDLDSLFDDQQLSDLDDFLDDVSDLSSVCSSDLSLDSDHDEQHNTTLQLSTPSPSPALTSRPPCKDKEPSLSSTSSLSSASSFSSTKSHGSGSDKSDLNCVACGRALKPEIVADPSAADVAVANELATWAWSPSAAFTDWRPKRCPRCERHVRVFTQEWPSRKIRKRPLSEKSSPAIPSTTTMTASMTAAKKRPYTKKQQRKKSANHSKFTNTHTNTFAPSSHTTVVVKKSFLRSPPTPTSEIFDGVEDLF